MGLNLKILDYRITSDKFGVQLSKLVLDDDGQIKIDKKTGKEMLKQTTYHPSVKSAINKLKKTHVYTSDDEITTLREYQTQFDLIQSEIDDALEVWGCVEK